MLAVYFVLSVVNLCSMLASFAASLAILAEGVCG